MRILINLKEVSGKIGIEAKLDTGCRDTARERAAGEALFHHLGDHFAAMAQTAEKPDRWRGSRRS
ncbi:MAG: hypothetical protein PHG96_13465 [Kiritimatiellae bacterium]|nr:hypothetical protein [Kiritimatiellia bacterium]